jgi:hypothetical protein
VLIISSFFNFHLIQLPVNFIILRSKSPKSTSKLALLARINCNQISASNLLPPTKHSLNLIENVERSIFHPSRFLQCQDRSSFGLLGQLRWPTPIVKGQDFLKIRIMEGYIQVPELHTPSWTTILVLLHH